MLLNLMLCFICIATGGDTLDVAKVSSTRDASAAAVNPVRNISKGGIERLGTIGLNEVLRQFSGVSVKDYGGVGGLKTVSVRNMGASHTSVIYDGIAISDAQNGQVDISRFNLDDIESVSVTIGCSEIFSSARHMTSAGVLNIERRRPDFSESDTEASARISIGSFGTCLPYISLSRKIGTSHELYCSAGGTISRGDYPFTIHNGNHISVEKRLNSDIRAISPEINWNSEWGNKGRMRIKLNGYFSERGLPGSVVLYTMNHQERLWDRSVNCNMGYDNEFGTRWRFHADIGYSNSYNRHLDTDPSYLHPQDSRYSQNEYSTAVRALLQASERLSFAIAEDAFVNTLEADIPECPSPIRFSWISAASCEFKTERLKINASAVSTYLKEWTSSGKVPAARFRLSPMAGISWNVSGGLYLRGSYKDGLRMPTFNDLYYARVGNTALKPETSRQFNSGLSYSGELKGCSFKLTADGYFNSIRDKIVAVPTMFIWKMRNIGRARMYGLEVTLSGKAVLHEGILLHASGGWVIQHAVDISDPEEKNYGHQLQYTPRNCGNWSFALEMPWLNISYTGNAVGIRYSKPQNIPANIMAPYTEQNLSLSRVFEFGKRYRYRTYISLDVMNLTGKNHEIIAYYPMPGRSFRISLKFQY